MSLSHRQHLALRELKELRAVEQAEREARERAAEEERTRPLRDAQAEFANTFREYLQVKRQNIEAGFPDGEFQIDPDAPTWFATQAEANAHNKRVGDEFVRLHPEYYASPQNLNALDHYLKSQGIDKIISLAYLEQAFKKLSELGMLEGRPVEVPEPTPTPAPERREPTPAPEPAGEWGYNCQTGEREFKSSYLIARMSAAEYRLFRRIPKDQLDLARLVRR